MATSVPDVAAMLDIASASPQVDPTPVEVPETEVPETPEGAEPEGGETPEGQEPAEKQVDARTNPAQIRSALKEFRDLKPENAPIARQLNDIVGRYGAYKTEFPTVAAARDARALLDAVGGGEGLSTLQATVKSVNDTDAALYAGDPKVLDSLYEDMKTAGKQDAFAKLAGPYLDKLRGLNEKAYFETLKPHFFQGLVDVGFPNVMQALSKALSGETPDMATAKGLLEEMTGWFDNLRNTVETNDKTKLDPERQAFEQERTEFQSTKQKEFNNNVATACDTSNNRELGTELGKYLKKPFFKNLGLEGKQDLGVGIKSQLFAELKADKSYQSQMDAFFSVPSPDKAKIEQYHNAKVKTMAARIVKSVVSRRYPNYDAKAPMLKAVTGKPAIPGVKPITPVAVKPTFVTTRPPQDQLDMSKDPDKYLMISGRGYLKGSGKFVAWSPKYR